MHAHAPPQSVTTPLLCCSSAPAHQEQHLPSRSRLPLLCPLWSFALYALSVSLTGRNQTSVLLSRSVMSSPGESPQASHPVSSVSHSGSLLPLETLSSWGFWDFPAATSLCPLQNRPPLSFCVTVMPALVLTVFLPHMYCYPGDLTNPWVFPLIVLQICSMKTS